MVRVSSIFLFQNCVEHLIDSLFAVSCCRDVALNGQRHQISSITQQIEFLRQQLMRNGICPQIARRKRAKKQIRISSTNQNRQSHCSVLYVQRHPILELQPLRIKSTAACVTRFQLRQICDVARQHIAAAGTHRPSAVPSFTRINSQNLAKKKITKQNNEASFSSP